MENPKADPNFSGQVRITLPNNMDYLPIVTNTVINMGKIMGFEKEDLLKLEKGTKEAVIKIIGYVYKKGEKATYSIILDPQELGLKIIIKEQGIPFDPDLIRGYDPKSVKKELALKELGTFLTKQQMDGFSFHNLGKEGMETHLFKYLDRHIHHLVNKEKLQKLEKERTGELLPKKSISYTVRRMKPEEAIEVSKVAYSAYGYTYINEAVYYPDRLRELNRSNDFISFVAVTCDGEIIAHNAFERREDKGIPELGVAFTKPEFRGRGCLNRLTTALLDEAEKQKFIGIFANGITTHPFSQKTLIKFGFRDCALYLSKGVSRIYKSIEQKKPQRESMVLFFRYVKHPQKLVIYPPAHHLEMIVGLYGHIGFKPEIKTTDNKTAPEIDKSILSVKTDLNALIANINVKTYGKDILPEILKVLKELCINRTETIYLRLRLNDPFTSKYTAEFEKMGFFFCGILPRSGGNDELILQYLNNYVIDFDQLMIASDKGKEILEYIKGCFAKV
ncbi:MAG: hypothetical protein DRJ05_14185 [Bacteroidetes bacterium]|nr:MAG: hypothetical protein DRJ05_14185 [Bacteroidota bacterium]